MSLTLKGFLTSAKHALKASVRTKPLTLVVGNESADLDSLCSSVIYAYLRTCASPGPPFIPLSNLPRADLALRPELTTVLGYASLKPTDLLTLDDLPDDLESSQWILVDHNALTGHLEKFQSRVIGCVDHHVDEGKLPVGVSPRVLATCGSCATLVVQQGMTEWGKLEQGEKEKVARLALGPIVIDTGNLLVKDKTTPLDESMVNTLEGVLGSGYKRQEYYDEINREKEDLSKMSLRDVMRKDYKEWTEAGVVLGTVGSPRGFEYLLEKSKTPEALMKAVDEWSKEMKVDIMSVMTIITTEGRFGREMMLWGITEKGKKVMREFENKYGETLGLRGFKDGVLDDKEDFRKIWVQGDIALGRKQIAPMLRHVMVNSAKI